MGLSGFIWICVAIAGIGALVVLLIALLDGGMTIPKASAISCFYFLVACSMITGIPFGGHTAVFRVAMLRVGGIILALPWSAVFFKGPAYSSLNPWSNSAPLVICAALNAFIIFALLSRKGKRSVDQDVSNRSVND